MTILIKRDPKPSRFPGAEIVGQSRTDRATFGQGEEKMTLLIKRDPNVEPFDPLDALGEATISGGRDCRMRARIVRAWGGEGKLKITLLIKRDPNIEPLDPLDVVCELLPRWIGRALEFYDVKLSQRFEVQLDRFERAISGLGARSPRASFACRRQ